jgi:hypothetical protein
MNIFMLLAIAREIIIIIIISSSSSSSSSSIAGLGAGGGFGGVISNITFLVAFISKLSVILS